MKYITIPESIKIGNDGEKDVFHTFSQWLVNPLNGKPFGKDGTTLRISCRLAARFENKDVGDEVALDKDEYALLSESSENVEGGFNTPVAKVFIPYMDAIATARDDDDASAEEAPVLE